MSWAVWVTRPPGSGTATMARETANRLAAGGAEVAWLELDAIATVLTPWPTYSAAKRDVVYRSLVFMAMALTEGGVPVLVEATGDRPEWRRLARSSINRFAEVHLGRPSSLAHAHGDPRAPEVADVSLAEEPGVAPELIVDTAVSDDVRSAAERIAALALGLGPVARPAGAPGGAVLWITGLPGSGKTTLASQLTKHLAREGVSVSMLEWAVLRDLVLTGCCSPEAFAEIAHRALAYTAKLLARAGLMVVVDATAPRRAWREFARQLVGRFAEVQLMCPAAVCLDRERTVRWRPRRRPEEGRVMPPLELALEYQYSLNPDLVLDTAARSEWTAAEDLLWLARRLLDRPAAPGQSLCA